MGDLRVKLETSIGIDLPKGYRETELGLLPEEWEVIKLEEAAGLVRGISWRKTEESPDGVPVVAIPNTHGGRVDFNVRYRISKNISSQKQLYEGNILLVGSSGSVHNVGRTAVVEEIPFPKATFASFLVKAEPSEGMDREFLYFLLRSSSIDFPACSKRAADGKYNLQVQALREHLVPLPPLSEQKAIAHVLRTVQKAIETTEQVIESTRELKRRLMNHLFTYGPVPVDEAEQVPLKETEIGSVPEHWEMVELDKLVQLRRESIHPDAAPGLRYVGLEHIDSGEVKVERWGQAAQVRSAKNRFYPGDILYGKLRPYLDKAALAEWEGMSSTDILVWVPNDRVVVGYAAYLVHTSSFLNHAIATTSGVNHPRTSWNSLKAFAVPLPSPSDQVKTFEVLGTIDKKISARTILGQKAM